MWYGVLCGLAAGSMWGMVFVLPKWLAEFSPFELMFGRYVAYALISLALLAPRLGGLLRRLTRADYSILLRYALAGNVVYYLLLSCGVQLAGVSAASLIIGLLPLTISMLGQRDQGALSLRVLAWPLALVAAGMVCINVEVFASRPGHAARPAVATGMLCAVGALLSWTWYAVDNTRFLKRNPRFSSGDWSGLFGIASGLVALAMGLVILCVGGVEPASAPPRDWLRFWGLITLVAAGASVIGNQLWNMACRRVPVTLSGQLLLCEILFGMLYGYLYQHQAPRLLEVMAMVLLVAGVAWSVYLHAEPRTTAPRPAAAASSV